MHIAIDMLIAERWYGDLHSSVRTLVRGLAQLEQRNTFVLITGRPEEYQAEAQLPNVRLYSLKLPPRQGILIQYQLHLPDVLRKLRPDVLHVQSSVAPIGWSGPLVITMQDTSFDDDVPCSVSQEELAYLDTHDAKQSCLDYRQRLIQASMRRANRIIVPSEHIYKELILRCAIEKERMCLVPNTASLEGAAQATLLAYQQAHVSNGRTIVSTTESEAAGATEDRCPGVSVIVPVSRPAKAMCVLSALKAQRYAGKIETIVVGSAATSLAHYWPIQPVNPGHIREPGRARNLGAVQAEGEILLFLDDDVVVAEDWVERNVRALQRSGAGIVGARIAGKSNAFFARCIDFTNYGQYQRGQPFDGPVASASMGVARAVFHEVGGFDETLLSGEDIDFCYRAQKQGYRSVYRPDIVVIHDHQRDTFRMLLRYNYIHGFNGGLVTKMRHRDVSLKNRLLFGARFPALFLLLLPLIALLASGHVVAMNITENRWVLLYAPFIFLGKLAYEFGIFMRLLTGRADQFSEGSHKRLPEE